MSATPQILQRLLDLSAAMVEAADAQDWDRLLVLGQDYFALFDQTKSAMQAPAANPALRILADNEALIRARVVAWMTTAGSLLEAWASLADRSAVSRPD